MCSAWIEQTLTTNRLTLRRPQSSDAPRVARLVGDFSVARMLTPVPHPYALADAEEFLERLDDPLTSDRVFAVEAPGAGLVGLVGFHHGSGQRFCEVGYWFGRDYWGLGYATEATSAALVWASEAWGKRAVLSGHFADNPASGRVLQKAGFLYTGERETRTSLARGAPVETRMMVWLA